MPTLIHSWFNWPLACSKKENYTFHCVLPLFSTPMVLWGVQLLKRSLGNSVMTDMSLWPDLLKVSKSQKQIMASWILPKNKRWGIFQPIKMPQHLFFGRIKDNIFFFEIYWPLDASIFVGMLDNFEEPCKKRR